jgi:hypothetical protein
VLKLHYNFEKYPGTHETYFVKLMAVKKGKKNNLFPLLFFVVFGSGMEKNLSPG